MDAKTTARMVAIENMCMDVFDGLRGRAPLRIAVFVMHPDGAAIGVAGFCDDREAFKAVLHVMDEHATSELGRVAEHRATRPQG